MRCEKVLYKRTAHIFKDFSVLREENKYNYLQTYPVVQDSWYHNFEITDCFHAETSFRYLQEDKLSAFSISRQPRKLRKNAHFILFWRNKSKFYTWGSNFISFKNSNFYRHSALINLGVSKNLFASLQAAEFLGYPCSHYFGPIKEEDFLPETEIPYSHWLMKCWRRCRLMWTELSGKSTF